MIEMSQKKENWKNTKGKSLKASVVLDSSMDEVEAMQLIQGYFKNNIHEHFETRLNEDIGNEPKIVNGYSWESMLYEGGKRRWDDKREVM